MNNVFISYKSDEFNEANWVKTKLEENNISCWMAPMSIHGGSSYAEEIPKAIRECDVFVLILSEKVQESKWVPRELDQAINNSKVILPFMIVDCTLKDDFEFYLSNVQRYEAYQDKSKALDKLIEDIKNLLPADVEESVDEGNAVTKDAAITPSQDEPTEILSEKVPSVKKEKKIKSKTEKKPKKTVGKKLKKPMVILGCIALVVAIVVSAITIFDANNTVYICNDEFKKDESYLRFENVSVTNDDVLNLAELDNISSISFKKCHLKGIDLNRIFKLVSYSITFDECSISNEDIANLNVKNTQIFEIVFDNNPQLSDLSVLNIYASTLKELSFNNCSVSDLSFVKDFTQLTSLSSKNNNISDISSLKSCTALESLCLSDNKITSLEAIRELSGITNLDVSNNQITSLAPIEKMIYLEQFVASGNKLTDISGLSNVTQLKTVDLSNNEISDVSVLAKSSLKLNTINISNNKISDITSLAVCNFIEEFIADNNALTDIDALKNWSELSKINVANNQISDVSPLSKCLKLSHVDLSHNKITSVDCLDFTKSNNYGIYLNVSNNMITAIKLSPFDCSDMIINGNTISDLSFLKDFESLGNLVFDYNEKIDFEAFKDSWVMSYYVLNCPLDKQVYVSTTLGAYSVKFSLE